MMACYPDRSSPFLVNFGSRGVTGAAAYVRVGGRPWTCQCESGVLLGRCDMPTICARRPPSRRFALPVSDRRWLPSADRSNCRWKPAVGPLNFASWEGPPVEPDRVSLPSTMVCGHEALGPRGPCTALLIMSCCMLAACRNYAICVEHEHCF